VGGRGTKEELREGRGGGSDMGLVGGHGKEDGGEGGRVGGGIKGRVGSSSFTLKLGNLRHSATSGIDIAGGGAFGDLLRFVVDDCPGRLALMPHSCSLDPSSEQLSALFRSIDRLWKNTTDHRDPRAVRCLHELAIFLLLVGQLDFPDCPIKPLGPRSYPSTVGFPSLASCFALFLLCLLADHSMVYAWPAIPQRVGPSVALDSRVPLGKRNFLFTVYPVWLVGFASVLYGCRLYRTRDVDRRCRLDASCRFILAGLRPWAEKRTFSVRVFGVFACPPVWRNVFSCLMGAPSLWEQVSLASSCLFF